YRAGIAARVSSAGFRNCVVGRFTVGSFAWTVLPVHLAHSSPQCASFATAVRPAGGARCSVCLWRLRYFRRHSRDFSCRRILGTTAFWCGTKAPPGQPPPGLALKTPRRGSTRGASRPNALKSTRPPGSQLSLRPFERVLSAMARSCDGLLLRVLQIATRLARTGAGTKVRLHLSQAAAPRWRTTA